MTSQLLPNHCLITAQQLHDGWLTAYFVENIFINSRNSGYIYFFWILKSPLSKYLFLDQVYIVWKTTVIVMVQYLCTFTAHPSKAVRWANFFFLFRNSIPNIILLLIPPFYFCRYLMNVLESSQKLQWHFGVNLVKKYLRTRNLDLKQQKGNNRF